MSERPILPRASYGTSQATPLLSHEEVIQCTLLLCRDRTTFTTSLWTNPFIHRPSEAALTTEIHSIFTAVILSLLNFNIQLYSVLELLSSNGVVVLKGLEADKVKGAETVEVERTKADEVKGTT